MTRTRFLKIALVAIGGLLAIPVLLIGLFYLWIWHLELKRPELVRPPTQGGQTGAWQVTNRLKQRFPVGSDARVLVSYLEKEKYQLKLHPINSSASATWSGFPCGGEVVVYWQEDSERKIVEIRGAHSIGCL
jgi:hypothetical protein